VRNGVIDELLDADKQKTRCNSSLTSYSSIPSSGAETMIMLPFQLPHRTQHQDQFNTKTQQMHLNPVQHNSIPGSAVILTTIQGSSIPGSQPYMVLAFQLQGYTKAYHKLGYPINYNKSIS